MSTQTATRDRPILFSSEMIRAILAGRKTMTRRLAKPPRKAVFLPDDIWRNDIDEPGTAYLDDESGRLRITCPHGQPGDQLWCKETWSPDHSAFYPNFPIVYRADGEIWDGLEPRGKVFSPELNEWFPFRWRSGRFMPRIVSRITLEITGVRVERLRGITEEDAIAEGCCTRTYRDGRGQESARHGFRCLWDDLNAKRAPWESNPFVWVISFRRIKP